MKVRKRSWHIFTFPATSSRKTPILGWLWGLNQLTYARVWNRAQLADSVVQAWAALTQERSAGDVVFSQYAREKKGGPHAATLCRLTATAMRRQPDPPQMQSPQLLQFLHHWPSRDLTALWPPLPSLSLDFNPHSATARWRPNSLRLKLLPVGLRQVFSNT